VPLGNGIERRPDTVGDRAPGAGDVADDREVELTHQMLPNGDVTSVRQDTVETGTGAAKYCHDFVSLDQLFVGRQRR
jgi:hypothetical protein